MALAGHGNQPFSARDAKIYPFSAGVPGTGKDVPGIVSVTSEPDQETVEHRGDNTTLSKVVTLNGLDLTLTMALWDADAIASMVGGTVTTEGTTPAQVRSLTHNVNDVPSDFALKVDAPSRSADGGATRLVYPRCQSGGLPNYGLTLDEYQDLEITATAIANADGDIVVLEQLETAAAMTTTF